MTVTTLRRVLVVEHDERRAAVAHIFQELECRVDLAASVDEALAYFQNFEYELVLTAWCEPEFDAVELARRIRALPRGQETPVWCITAHRTPEDAVANGLDGAVSEPVDRQALASELVQGRLKRTQAPADRPWARLAERIQQGDVEAMEQLYGYVAQWTRSYLRRWEGQEAVEDRVHDTYLAVLQRIQESGLRDPRLLAPFVFGVVRNMVAAQFARKIRRKETELSPFTVSTVAGASPNPEQQVVAEQRRQQVIDLLNTLGDRDREILVRFYIEEQPREKICTELGLTETQFRLFKSRALARLSKIRREREAAG